MTLFAHLRAHTPYSLAEGAARIKAIAKVARERGLPAVAMTDTGGMAGTVEFCKYLSEAGVQPIVGIQLDLAFGGRRGPVAFLCRTEAGHADLMALASKASLAAEHGERATISTEDVERLGDGVILLTGGPESVADAFAREGKIEELDALLSFLSRNMGDRAVVELTRLGRDDDVRISLVLAEAAAKAGLAIVAANETFFIDGSQHEAHDALLCIAGGTQVAAADRRRVSPEQWLKSAEEMTAIFADLPEAIENSLAIARRCSFVFSKKKPMLPAFPGLDGTTEAQEIERRAKEGLAVRLKENAIPEEIRHEYAARLDYEIGVIVGMGFPGYFLIVSDFIGWAKDNGIAVGPGRGSGAGSLVAWSLRITDLDPLRYGLLFERFLNPERVSMPDFDIDFEQERRGEVIEYVKARYGAERVGQIGTYGKLQARAVIRDVGRALQIPYPVVDRFCKMIPNNPAQPVGLAQAMESEPLASELRRADSSINKLFALGLGLEGLFRHSSTHAAGVVIADRPLSETVPLMRDEHGNAVSQYDMKAVEEAGLVKFDFLGLKTLDVIQGAVAMIRAAGETVDLDAADPNDPDTYAMLAKGEAFGVFQLESAGMRKAMREIVPNAIDDLVALVSLYRPGPMAEIPNYASVKNGQRKASYEHEGKAFSAKAVELLRPILDPTYGVIIYQEQVMEIGRKLAGYSLGGADLLRRAMGKKIKEEMDKQRGVFVAGCSANGIEEETSNLIFDKVAKFADYGFNKSHAAAYAVIAFKTAWLRRHHPMEFYAASMNLDLDDVDKLSAFREEIRKDGIRLGGPDVNLSKAAFSVEKGKAPAIRYGLAAIRNVGRAAMEEVVKERLAKGPFTSFSNFVDRTAGIPGFNKRTLEGLIKAGALDSIHGNRAALLADADRALRQAIGETQRKAIGQTSLFDGFMQPTKASPLPNVPPASVLERLRDEREALGLYLSGHPIAAAAQNRLKRVGAFPLRELLDENRTWRGDQKVGVLLSDIKLKTSKQDQRPMAILFLSDPGATVECMLFDDDLQRYRPILVPGEAFLLTVGVSDKSGERRLHVREIEPLPLDEGFDGKAR
jgi:DNA polymerase-3 subunit alpha